LLSCKGYNQNENQTSKRMASCAARFRSLKCQEASPEKFWECPRRLSWLFRGDGDGNSQPNTDEHAETSTTGKPVVPRWKQKRTGGPADDGLRRSSRG